MDHQDLLGDVSFLNVRRVVRAFSAVRGNVGMKSVCLILHALGINALENLSVLHAEGIINVLKGNVGVGLVPMDLMLVVLIVNAVRRNVGTENVSLIMRDLGVSALAGLNVLHAEGIMNVLKANVGVEDVRMDLMLPFVVACFLSVHDALVIASVVRRSVGMASVFMIRITLV